MTDAAAIRDQAIEVGRGWSGPAAPASWALTAELFQGLASDPDLLALAAAIRPDRLPALVFVAAVHAVVLTDRDDALTAYFPIDGNDAERPVDSDFPAAYRRFCLERREQLAAAWAGRTYQMNEVARRAQVALALADIEGGEPGRRVGLIDVGTGAGLGLYPDRYRYRFSDGTTLGDPTSPVDVRCEIGAGRLPADPQLPVITQRIGIDLHPVDLADREARAWLAACIPPEPGAVERFAAASAFVADRAPRIHSGDAADLLPGVIEEIERFDDVDVVVVTDAYTAVFFPPADLDRFRSTIVRAAGPGDAGAGGSATDVVWVSLDPLVPLGTGAHRTVLGNEAPEDLVAENRAGGVFGVLAVQERVGDDVTDRVLATAHPSGTRLRWLA